MTISEFDKLKETIYSIDVDAEIEDNNDEWGLYTHTVYCRPEYADDIEELFNQNKIKILDTFDVSGSSYDQVGFYITI